MSQQAQASYIEQIGGYIADIRTLTLSAATAECFPTMKSALPT